MACAINELSLLTRQIFPNTQLQEAALLEATEGDRQAPAEIERKREETGASVAGGLSRAAPGASPSDHSLRGRLEAGRGAEQELPSLPFPQPHTPQAFKSPHSTYS